MTTAIPQFLIALLIVCLGLSQNAPAVSPPPDGGYPGGNTAEGQNALLSLTTGTFNTAVGWFSLQGNLAGNFNTAIGAGTLVANTSEQNTATGTGALLSNTTGFSNTANGVWALINNTSGNTNTATGGSTLFRNGIGNGNTANGWNALVLNFSGDHNTAIGFDALTSNQDGSGNTAVGAQTLQNSTGSGSIAIGFNAGALVGSSNNVIAIGSPGDDVDNSCFIGNIRDVQTQNADAITVVVDSAGQLGTVSSSRRFKKEIKSMGGASDAILALKPVTFHYKSDKTDTPQFGLIAEEVAKVNPNLVVRDKNGDIHTVRYEAVNAMLLNEFLKEHRKVEEQEGTIADLQKQIDALTAGLQKVNAQLEVSKPAPQTVLNSD